MKTPGKLDPPQARKPYTPQATQNRILEGYLNGKSNRQIAREERIDRATVGRILSREEVVRTVAEGRSRLLGLVPKALDGYEESVDSTNEKIALSTRTNILKFTGVAEPIEVPEPERDRERGLDAAMGQIMRMAMTKAVRCGTDLPDSLIEQLRFAKETLEAYEARNPGAAVASLDTSEF